MRSYPTNSPQAAARLVALAMLIDGHASRVEMQALESLGLPQRLGISVAELSEVTQALCEDLMGIAETPWTPSRLDAESLTPLLAEISDPALRSTVLQACVVIAAADSQLHEAESLLLLTALQHWQMSAQEDGVFHHA
ncbi:TerB family tellurite resistance protein [Roseateles aquae]|nr:TerB family tellurite resistance protein [Paucibacter sp. APW11]